MNTMIIVTVVTAVVSYLIGSVNFSILISKAISGKDIRESGSGNAGATNMLRTHGKKMAIITLLCDIAKGVLAVLLAILLRWVFEGGRLVSFPNYLAVGLDGVENTIRTAWLWAY